MSNTVSDKEVAVALDGSGTTEKINIQRLFSLKEHHDPNPGSNLAVSCHPFEGIKAGETITGERREELVRFIDLNYSVEIDEGCNLSFEWREAETLSCLLNDKVIGALCSDPDLFGVACQACERDLLTGNIENGQTPFIRESPWVYSIEDGSIRCAFFNSKYQTWDLVTASTKVPMIHLKRDESQEKEEEVFSLYSHNQNNSCDLLSVLEKCFRAWWTSEFKDSTVNLTSILVALTGSWELLTSMKDGATSIVLGNLAAEFPPSQKRCLIVSHDAVSLQESTKTCSMTNVTISNENLNGSLMKLKHVQDNRVARLSYLDDGDHSEPIDDISQFQGPSGISVLSTFETETMQSYTVGLLSSEPEAEEDEEDEYDETMHLVVTTGPSEVDEPVVVRVVMPPRSETEGDGEELANSSDQPCTYGVEVFEVDAEMYEEFDDPRVFWMPNMIVAKATASGNGNKVARIGFTIQQGKVYMIVPTSSEPAILNVNLTCPSPLELAVVPDPNDDGFSVP